MPALVECVPNFSEGRKPETVRQIAASIAAVESTCVLDTHIDPDHNRSVITFVAEPGRVVEAVGGCRATSVASSAMRTHQGEHPRLGATDAFAVRSVKRSNDGPVRLHLLTNVGEIIARELSIPV